MATRIIPALGWPTLPDTSGNVFAEPASLKGTNDPFPALIWVFNDTSTRLGLRSRFFIPPDYVGTPVILVEWTATATSGNVVWDFDYRAVGGNDAESLDQSGVQEAVTVTDAAPTAAWRKLEASMALTGANLAAGDEVQFELFRDGADGADTMAAAALLYGVRFSYSDV